ncbi:MAG: ABA4-like family protein [Cyanobacteria bacterium J06621_12]
MTLNQLFIISNIYAMFFWFFMIVLPKRKITQKIFSSFWLFIPLILLYIYYLSVSFNIELIEILRDFKLENVARLFSREGVAGGGWTHFLAVDLFLGRWIYWQGQEKNIWTAHSLIMCLFFGPVGLLSHIITDAIANKNDDAGGNDPDDQKSDGEASLSASK